MSSGPVDTAQSAAWRGDFGTLYTERNLPDEAALAGRLRLWSALINTMQGAMPQSVLEVGANAGLNLRALRLLCAASFHAVEPNAQARARLIGDGVVPAERVYDSIATAIPLDDGAVDLAFTSGVLIHIAPDQLLESCREIHRVSRRYVACVEYFSDKPSELPYRNHDGLLFKRDFGSFYLDNFADLRVIDYGFFWKRVTGLDNLTWWVFEKTASAGQPRHL